MSGRPSDALVRAVRRVQRGETAYSAAKREGIALSTIYRSRLYQQQRDKPRRQPPPRVNR